MMDRCHRYCWSPSRWDLPAGPEGFFFSHNPVAFPSKRSRIFLPLHFLGTMTHSPFPRSSGPAAALLPGAAGGGENGLVARSFNSSPPLTGLSPLPHDWQRQAGGGRPAGRKPAPELARICRRRHAEGLAETSLTAAGVFHPHHHRQSDVHTRGLIRPTPCVLLHRSLAPSTAGKR